MNKEAIIRALADTQTERGSSRWGSLRTCPRQHHLRYEVKLERVVEGPREEYFAVGSFVHGILRYVQDGVVAGEAEPRRWEDVLEYASRSGADAWPLDEASRLMRWYWKEWGINNAGWGDAVIVAVEREMIWGEGKLPHTGRADTILSAGGAIIVADTKTRKQDLPKDPDAMADWIKGASTNPQFVSLSAMVQREMGLEQPPEVLVNVIVKTAQPKFRRVRVPIPQRHVDIWAANHARWAAIADTLDGADLMNPSECYPAMGSKCYFSDYCWSSDGHKMKNWRAKP